MKTIACMPAVILLVLSVGVLNADTPGLHPGVQLYDGASVLDVGDTAAPVVVDWNNDGKKDMVVGTGLGHVFLFLNQNTDADPQFSGHSEIKSNNVPIVVSYVGGG